MNAQYVIRRLRAGTPEMQTVRELDRALFPFDKVVKLDRGTWWLVYDRQTHAAVGFAGLAVRGRWGALVRAGVLPCARGEGLHPRLIAVRLAAARRLGLGGVTTYTTTDNSPSANNLIDAGFRLGRQRRGKRFLEWRLRLSEEHRDDPARRQAQKQ